MFWRVVDNRGASATSIILRSSRGTVVVVHLPGSKSVLRGTRASGLTAAAGDLGAPIQGINITVVIP